MLKKRKHVIVIVASIIIIVLGILLYCFFDIEMMGENIKWRGNKYVVSTYYCETSHIIGMTSKGFKLYKIEDDDEINFLFMESYTTQYYFKKMGYDIPIDGEITSIYIEPGNKKICSEKLCKTLQCIIDDNSQIIEIDRYSVYKQLKSLYVAYNNCPVAVKNIGYICNINGDFIYIGSEQELTASLNDPVYVCKIIDDEYIDTILENPDLYSVIKID